jgi:hypothetical protein
MAWYQRRADERAQARAESRAAATPAAPEVAATPTRSFGFQSGAARVNEGREKNLATAGTELGAPTSWAGGEGAPQPIGVIRGMKQTYATDTGGPQLAEFATVTQAKQGFNRAQSQNGGYGGEYVPPAGPEIAARGEQLQLAAAAENKRPDLVEATQAAKEKKLTEEHLGTLTNYLTNTYGKMDPTTRRMTFKPADEGMARDALASEEIARQEAKQGRDGGKAAIAHFQDRQNVRSLLNSKKDTLPPGFDVNAYLSAAAQNPKVWQELAEEGRKLRTSTRPPARKPWFEQMAESSEYGVGP